MSKERLASEAVRPGSTSVSAAELVALAEKAVGGSVGTVELPANPGTTAPWPSWADSSLIAALQRRGIRQPWQHQIAAAEVAHSQHNVVIATGTASGKSLAYWLPVLSSLNEGPGTALYCTPTKALAQDQLARLLDLDLAAVTAACYDGDTPKDIRPWMRRNANYILTNPDMLHRSILPDHQRWTSFLRRLRYVILDEGHTYRGVFGSHMAAIMRRLTRLAQAAGAQPTFIVTSATLAKPEESAAALLGQPVTAVTQDTSARGSTTVVIADPQPEDGGAFGAVSAALAAWTSAGVRSLGFIRSRAGAEALATAVAGRLPDPADAAAVAPYRGGLLPEERRDIESGLRSGRLRCVATTNALELGVDISGLDAVALCGWPGRRSSFLQQIGRAGREGADAVAILTAQQDPLDQFYARHPQQILAEGVEAAVFDPANPYVLIPHLAAAISEQPMSSTEAATVFGPASADALAALAGKRMIRQRGDRWFWVDRARASDLADLRSTGAAVTVIEAETARVLGTVDRAAAPAQVHPGAVYVHLGAIHVIEALDLEHGVAVARREDPGYTTVAQSVSDLNILATAESRASGAGTMHFGDVEVGSQVVSFLRRRAGTGEVLGSEPLEMPRQQLRTRAVWWQLPDLDVLDLPHPQIPGAAHAAEHAAIGILPALATCDRWDIGGLSTERHPDTDQLSIFIYDGHPGGAGFARRGFEEAYSWLGATRDVVAACPCPDGCPACVQSPKCGNGNEPLDKPGAVALLDLLRPTAP